MRTIIAGSRSITKQQTISTLQNHPWLDRISLVICGTAKGVDTDARDYLSQTRSIPYEDYPADWDTYGKRAGYLRNEVMLRYADALIAIWDGQSKGTKHMIDIAKTKGILVSVHIVSSPDTDSTDLWCFTL